MNNTGEEHKKLYEMHADMCRVFTNPKRLEILNLLRDGEKSVTDLARLSGLKQANLSQHLSILRQKGVVKTRREGVMVCYSLASRKIVKAFDIIREMLYERLLEEKRVLE